MNEKLKALLDVCAAHDLADRVVRVNGRQSVEFKTVGSARHHHRLRRGCSTVTANAPRGFA